MNGDSKELILPILQEMQQHICLLLIALWQVPISSIMILEELNRQGIVKGENPFLDVYCMEIASRGTEHE